MKDYADIVRQIERETGPLLGTRVLDVGTDMRDGGMVRTLAEKAMEVVGINLVGASRVLSDRASLMQQDVRKMSFPDDSFDLVVSYAAFEHVNDFDVALDEMFRVLRPGGLLFASFGPIWSCKWGHHLWYRRGDVAYTYQNLVLPPYCHLYMSAEALKSAVEQKIDAPSDVNAVVEYILNSNDQSRNMHSDYVRMLNGSKFTMRTIKRSPNINLNAKYGAASASVLNNLRAKYPDEDNFDAASITFSASKPGGT